MSVDPRGIGDQAAGPVRLLSSFGEGCIRILAPNPSPMTLDGTNTYLLFDSETGSGVVVDPGPVSVDHQERILSAASSRGLEISGVVLTHHHRDHAASASDLATLLAVPLLAHPDSSVAGVTDALPSHGRASVGGVDFEVIPTPGHCGDHLAFMSAEGYLLTGDHVLGRGTTVVLHPDGDLAAYLRSLHTVADLDFVGLLPGHGPELEAELAKAVIEFYLDHRTERIAQIVDLIATKPGVTVEEITLAIYGSDVSPMILWAGRATTEAAVAMLVEEGVIRRDGGRLAMVQVMRSKYS